MANDQRGMKRRSIAKPVVLLTGFDSFPGVPGNASIELIHKIAAAAPQALPGISVHAEILPTEWQRAPEQLGLLYNRHAPNVALHFGVSSKACGFEIETAARNETCDLVDANGALPAGPPGTPSCPQQQFTDLPVNQIVARLCAMGLPATVSDDAGSYVCNALYYEALGLCAANRNATMAAFIHIPDALAYPDAPAAPDDFREACASALTWPQAVFGGLEIITACLGVAASATQGAHS